MSDNMHIRYCEWRWNLLRLTSFAYSTPQLLNAKSQSMQTRVSESADRVLKACLIKSLGQRIFAFVHVQDRKLSQGCAERIKHTSLRWCTCNSCQCYLFKSLFVVIYLFHLARTFALHYSLDYDNFILTKKERRNQYWIEATTHKHGVSVAHCVRMKSRGAEKWKRPMLHQTMCACDCRVDLEDAPHQKCTTTVLCGKQWT